MSEELKAIEKISEQLDGYKKELAEKADKNQYEATEKALAELKDNLDKWSEKKIDEAIEEINKSVKEQHDLIVEIKEEQAQAKEKSDTKVKTSIVSTEEIKAFIEATFKDGKKTNERATITIKAPETFGFNQTFNGDGTGVQIDAFTGREIDPVLYQRTRKRNLILDHIPISTISVPKLFYLEKEEVGDTNPTSGDPGSADWILSGAAKPQRSFRLKTGEAEAKKVAIFGTIEDKLLRDVASMENWIREDFMDEIMEKYNEELLNNAASATVPLGLKANAVQFVVTPAFTDLYALNGSNKIDQIIAAIAAMKESKEVPAKAFVSDDVFYSLHNLKATDGKYLNNNLIYVNSLGQLFIAGVEIVPADSDDVPSTHLLLISQNLGFKIKNYGSMVFERGLNGEDFREDKTSYRGYQEVLSYIPENRENSVMYDTFANIKLGVEAVA